jgi:hypothetical protein
MGAMTEAEWREVAEALLVWSGKGHTSYPSRSEVRLQARYGSEMTARLLPLIKMLETDFYASDARYTAATLSEMGEQASAEFRRKYPQLPSNGVDALAWCYTWDFK